MSTDTANRLSRSPEIDLGDPVPRLVSLVARLIPYGASRTSVPAVVARSPAANCPRLVTLRLLGREKTGTRTTEQSS